MASRSHLDDDDDFGGDFPGANPNRLSGTKRSFGDIDDDEDDIFGSKKANIKVEETAPGVATGMILSLRESLQSCQDTLETCQSELEAAKSEVQKWHSAFQKESFIPAGSTVEPRVVINYLQNLKSSEESLREQLEKTKRKEAAFMVTIAKREQEIADLKLRKMLDLLVHASQCRSPLCQYPNCRKVQGLFRHGINCKVRAAGGCVLCKEMWYLLQLHSRSCKDSQCHVPRCRDLKEPLRRLQQQADSHRRAAVMEMMRQRATGVASDDEGSCNGDDEAASELEAAKSEVQKWHSAFQESFIPAGSTVEPRVVINYLQNLKSSEESLREQLEKTKRKEAAFIVTIAKREQEIADLKLRKMLDLLVHASQCRSPLCQYPNCRKVQGLFRHGINCKVLAAGGCVLCKKMWYLLQLHSRSCKDSQCHVPRCRDLKEPLRRLQQQGQL